MEWVIIIIIMGESGSWQKVKILFYPLLADVRKSNGFWKVPTLRHVVLLLKALCRWRYWTSTLYIKFVPHTQNTSSNIKNDRLLLCRETKAAYFKNHTKHINTLCGQNSTLLLLNLAMHIVTSRFTGLICCNIILCNTILIVREASGWKWLLVPRHYKHIKNVIICNDVNFRHYLRIAYLKTLSVNSENAASTVCHINVPLHAYISNVTCRYIWSSFLCCYWSLFSRFGTGYNAKILAQAQNLP